MKQLVAFVILVFTSGVAFGQTQDTATADTPTPLSRPATAEMELSDFLWVSRPVIVFAESPNDPRFKKQMDLLNALPEELVKRDVVVITDTAPDAETPIREKLRPRGFMLVLIGKDGTILLRKPSPWDVRELTRSIDKLPARQQEMRDRRAPPK